MIGHFKTKYSTDRPVNLEKNGNKKFINSPNASKPVYPDLTGKSISL
jgi:hypothetical protein